MLVSLGVVSSLTGFHTQQSALDLCRSSSASVAFSLSHLSLKTLCCFVVLGLDSLNHELVSFSWLHMSAFFVIIVANMVPYFRLDLFCISLLVILAGMLGLLVSSGTLNIQNETHCNDVMLSACATDPTVWNLPCLAAPF